MKRRPPFVYHGWNDDIILDIRLRLAYWTGPNSSLVGSSDLALPPIPEANDQTYSDLFKDVG